MSTWVQPVIYVDLVPFFHDMKKVFHIWCLPPKNTLKVLRLLLLTPLAKVSKHLWTAGGSMKWRLGPMSLQISYPMFTKACVTLVSLLSRWRGSEKILPIVVIICLWFIC